MVASAQTTARVPTEKLWLGGILHYLNAEPHVFAAPQGSRAVRPGQQLKLPAKSRPSQDCRKRLQRSQHFVTQLSDSQPNPLLQGWGCTCMASRNGLRVAPNKSARHGNPKRLGQSTHQAAWVIEPSLRAGCCCRRPPAARSPPKSSSCP